MRLLAEDPRWVELIVRMSFDVQGYLWERNVKSQILKAGDFNLDVKGSDSGFLTRCTLGSPSCHQGTGWNGAGCAGRYEFPQSVLIKMIC